MLAACIDRYPLYSIYLRLRWVCVGVQFAAAAGRCHEHNASQTPVPVENKRLEFKF